MRFSAKLFRLFFSSLCLAVFSTATASADVVVSTASQLVTVVNNTGNGGDRTILIDKQSRPHGTGIDIGADQCSLTVPDKNPFGPNSRSTLSWLFLLTGTTP